MTREFAKLVLDSLATWEGRERMITAEQVEAIKVLSQEHSLPEDLEEAAEKYKNSHLARAYWLEGELIEEATPLDIAFKAGAMWREAQIPITGDMRDAADEYSATPDNKRPVDGEKYKAFIARAKWDRAKMMEEAVKGEVIGYDDGTGKFITVLEDLPEDSPYKVHDKVRLIVIPEEK